jgi:dTDP-4-amino-4,6-dideoxy-D-glucose/dTDP-4-amino-2,4-dideoxy-beta-L-xylose transaminase
MAADASQRVAAVLESGYIGQGPVVDAFETALSNYLGHQAPLTVNSATSGLTLALRLIAGDREDPGEVLTPPITCTATNWAILAARYRIKWVDTNPADGNMDLADLRRKLSERTRAIMLVHWGGYPNDLTVAQAAQQECLERFGHWPPIVEDAAHAFGAEFNGIKIGGHGNFCVFSFQAIKHVTSGDGGALLCPDDQFTSRARLMRWYGLDRTRSELFRCEQDITEWGYKFHMNDINAAIGLANLSHIEQIVQLHRDNGAYYRRMLSDVPGITLLEDRPNRRSSYWIFTLRATNRDGLQARLRERGVTCGRVHDRNDRYTCTQQFQSGPLPGTDVMHREMLCIPVGWWVTPDDREFIVKCIREGW